MREKLKELSEILKQDTAIKERLEKLDFGCWVQYNFDDIEAESHKYIGEFEDISGKLAHHFLCIEDNEKVILDIKEIGTWITVIGREPQYSDILEYLGGDYAMDYKGLYWEYNVFDGVQLSPGPLSEQTDEKLDEIISLCNSIGIERI